MKKFSITLLVAFIALSVTVGSFASGGKEAAKAEAGKVQVMHLWGSPAEKAIIDEVVGNFEKANPNIKVEQLVFSSKAYHPKILQMMAGDNPPDIYLSYPGFKTYDLVDRGVIHSLSDMWSKYNLKEHFSQGAKDSVSYKGKQWNLPWVTHANIVVYNVKVFKDLGLSEPDSLEAFEAICDKIKGTGKYPLASGWKALYRAAYPIELLLPSVGGGELYGKLAAFQEDWDNDAVKKTLAIWKRWVEKGYWYPDPRARSWPEALGHLGEGLVAMKFIGTYATSVLEGDVGLKYSQDYDLFTFPQINKSFPKTLTGPYDALSIPKKAVNIENAEKLLAYMATAEAQSVRSRAGGLVLNKNVTDYGPPMMKVKKAVEEGASFRPGFFQASPPLGLKLINHGAMPDFYDDPDPQKFIQRANAAKKEYLAGK